MLKCNAHNKRITSKQTKIYVENSKHYIKTQKKIIKILKKQYHAVQNIQKCETLKMNLSLLIENYLQTRGI